MRPMECRAGTRTDAQDAHPDTSGRKNDGGKDPTGGDSVYLLQYADLAQPEMRALFELVGTLNV